LLLRSTEPFPCLHWSVLFHGDPAFNAAVSVTGHVCLESSGYKGRRNQCTTDPLDILNLGTMGSWVPVITKYLYSITTSGK
jgi:hypothetical protein